MNLQPFKDIPVGTRFRMPWTRGDLRNSILEKVSSIKCDAGMPVNALYVETKNPLATKATIPNDWGKAGDLVMVEVVE